MDNSESLPADKHGDFDGRRKALADPLQFELSSNTAPALRFINPEGKVGAAIAMRYEPLSGQGSLQYVIYDQEGTGWCEPFRVNGDEHPPEEPNSRFNRHARFLYGFYTPGVTEPEKASMEFHSEPGQVAFQITSHKTNRPLMVLNQIDAPQDGFPIIVVQNPSGLVFSLCRNGDLTLRGALHAGGGVTIEAAVTHPTHAATKDYVDQAVAPLKLEIEQLRGEIAALQEGLRAAAAQP
jgi:hypothetical protein